MTQNATPVDEKIEFDREIAQLEQTLSALKQRQAEIECAQQEQIVLERQRNELKHKASKHPTVQQELQLIRSRLEQLELTLESRLLNEWKLMWEPFWQAVRFGGLGVAIGWFISTWGR